MKSVVLVSPHYFPESNAGSRRITSLAEELARRDWRVRIITQLPHHPQNQIYDGYNLRYRNSRIENGVEVIRLRPWIVPKHSLALRLLSELYFCLRAMPHLLRTSHSIIVASSPYMFLGPLGLVVGRIKDTKFVWDVRDLTWLYPRALGKNTLGLDKPLESLMLWVGRRADALTTATEGLLSYFNRQRAHSLVFANGVSNEFLETLVKLPLSSSVGRPKVVYAGLIGYNQGLTTLVDVAQLLPEVDFVLAGDGPERARLESRVATSGLTNVSFPGHLNHSELISVYRDATILVGHLRGDPLHRWSQPSKVWEYMATGRPVVYAGEGEVIAIIEEHHLGLTTPPGQPDAFAAAIRALLDEPERARALASRGQAYVLSTRKRSSLIEQFVILLESLLLPET